MAALPTRPQRGIQGIKATGSPLANAIVRALRSGAKQTSVKRAVPKRPDLLPGPRFDVQGVYRGVPNTGDKIDPARLPNEKYPGRMWGKATKWKGAPPSGWWYYQGGQGNV